MFVRLYFGSCGIVKVVKICLIVSDWVRFDCFLRKWIEWYIMFVCCVWLRLIEIRGLKGWRFFFGVMVME